MAQSSPSFSLIAGYDTSVSGDVHKGAIAPIADLGPLVYARTGAGSTQVGDAYVLALDTTLPVYGRFGGYAALALEGGYRYYFGSGGSVRPYIAGRLGTTHVSSIKATFTIPDANIALNDVPFFKSGWPFSGGADLGVLWALTDKTSLGLEVGARCHGNLSGDDSALAGLGLAGINNTGKRISCPVNLRLQMRF